MKQTYSLTQKFRQLFIILLPILVTQVAMFAMNFFDTIMSGQASAQDLAGVAIGSSIWLPINTGLGGIFFAITPIVAHLIGANDKEEVPYKVMQGVYLAITVSLIVVVVGALTLEPILSLMSLEPSVRNIARGYLKALALGITPLFIYFVLRSFIDALGKTQLTMLIALISLPINVFLNYVLIFGKFGFPAMGGVGAGVATTITYWCLMLIALVIVIYNASFKVHKVFEKFFRVSFKAWKEQLKIGVPIAFAIFFETSIFAVVTLLMSSFNTITIASHQAAMNFASLLYMVPLSISMGLTILVGFEVGGRRFAAARQYSFLGMGVSLTMALITAAILLFFTANIAGFYSREAEVIRMTQEFLILALFFQLSDAIAAPIQGALRGYKDVNVTFIMALISYWIVGLPLGYYLVNFTSLGVFGYWIGLISGLAVNAIGLFWRLVLVQRRVNEKKTLLTH